MYDTSSRETFDKLEEWLNEVEMYTTKKDIIKMLVGNKIDKVPCISSKYHTVRSNKYCFSILLNIKDVRFERNQVLG